MFRAPDNPFYPFAEALLIGLGMFAVISMTTYFIYQHSMKALKDEIQNSIRRTASAISQFIDTEFHQTLTHRAKEPSAAYREALIPQEKAQAADPAIAFVYTVIMRSEKVFFIIDPTPEGERDDRGILKKSHIGDEYTGAISKMLYALTHGEQIVESKLTENNWGWFLSGDIPVKNLNGKLFVGLSASDYMGRLEPFKRATGRTIMTGFLSRF